MTTTSQADTFNLDVVIPPAYAASLEQMAPNVGALIDSQQGASESWYDALARLLPVLASTYQQKQLLSVQVERARNGLPPLDVSQYAPGVNVGVDDKTRSLIMWGGAAALALLAFMAMRRR